MAGLWKDGVAGEVKYVGTELGPVDGAGMGAEGEGA